MARQPRPRTAPHPQPAPVRRPALRARFLEFARTGIEQINSRFATSRGLAPDDLKLTLTAVAILDAGAVAFERWQESDGKQDVLALFDQAVEALIDGVTEMHGARTRPRRRS